MLKYQKTCQIILLILGVSMISYGAVRGEAAFAMLSALSAGRTSVLIFICFIVLSACKVFLLFSDFFR